MQNDYILTPFFLDESLPDLEALVGPDWSVNKPAPPDDAPTQARMSAIHEPLAELVADSLRRGRRPVSVGGDCCATIGMLAGLQRAGVDPLLVWFDAHGDFNTWETTPSGFLGGMPLAMLAGLGDQTMPAAVGLRSLPADQVILTDARDLDPGERELVAGSGVQHLPDVGALLDHPLGDRPLYVHFDVDVLNLEDVPAVSYPAAGGPHAGELGEVFRFLAGTGRIAAVSLSAWNPTLDGADQSRETCMALLETLVGG